MWLDFGQNELEVPLAAWVYPALGLISANEEATVRAKEDVKSVLAVLDEHLSNNTFLVGECISLADISISISLSEAYRTVFDPTFLKPFPNVNRWYYTCINQRNFSKVMGNLNTPLQASDNAQSKTTTAVSGKQTASKKQPEEELPPEDDKPTPSKKNVIDELPPSTMVFDEWKRVYSNTKELENVAMKWFWENYDPSGYSIYFVEYQKLPNECQIDYVTANLLNGFMQRFEGTFRKYSFSVMAVVGRDKSFDIKGVWMFRGQDIPAEMKEHPSFDYYTFTRLDHSKSEDKKRITNYWCSLDSIDGVPIFDRKVWK